MGGEDGLAGAEAICRRAFDGRKWDWLAAAELCGGGKYEDALKVLDEMDENKEGGGSEGGTVQLGSVAAVGLRAEAYAAVRDWESLQKWIKVMMNEMK